MSPERWEKVTEIYHSALELEQHEREKFLDERCANDESLRREVESLLLADAAAGSFIDEPAIKDAAPLFAGATTERSLIGKRLGNYRVLSLIGAGGMGEVYLAEDVRLHRTVAVKTLPAALSDHPKYLRRFETEAKAISALNHPNILTIHEIGETDGAPFLVTEYVAGETLRARLEGGAALDLRDALEIAVQIVSALAAAHEKGIVHRDIKPENIMLRDDGLVKVLDFGLAKLIEEPIAPREKIRASARFNTAAGVILGTVAYMSPEQARGKSLDVKTDIWSFGVCLYEMLVGKLPFDGETASDRIAAILQSEPTNDALLAEIPRELQRVVDKCLRKERAERYADAATLLLDLREVKYELDYAAKQENLATKEMRHGDAELETARMIKAESRDDRVFAVSNDARRLLPFKQGRTIFAAWMLAAALGFSLFFLYQNFYRGALDAENSHIDSIAVMPFVNESDNADAEYLSDGISESLINSLSQLPNLKVIARSSSFKYKNRDVDASQAARELGVATIVSGRVSERGGNLQISVELINAHDRTQIWGEQYKRRSLDLLAVQSEISREIAGQLRARLSHSEEQRLARNETDDPAAYELLLKGRLFRSRGGAENRRKAIEYFEKAVERDPSFALAYAEMSETYRALINNRLTDPKELIFKANQTAQKAVDLDDRSADAHYALAAVKRFTWDWTNAEREYRRAIELNPNLAIARNGYAVYLTLINRHDEAVEQVTRARELDPLSLPINANVGYTLYFARRYDEAFEPLRKTLELDPNYATAHSILAAVYEGKAMYREAVDGYREAIRLGASNSGLEIHLATALAHNNEKEKAREILRHLKSGGSYVSSAELAMLYDALGEREQAFALLDKAYAEYDVHLQYLGVAPSFDSLRSDARFRELLRRVGLNQNN